MRAIFTCRKGGSMKSEIMKHNIQGFEIESWYEETACHWRAFIKGTGTVTDVHNREDAVFKALDLEKSTYCPLCKDKGKLCRLESEHGAHFGLACIPCGYAQSKPNKMDWYFIASGMMERSLA